MADGTDGKGIVGETHLDFITRKDCPLCEKGEKVLRSVAKRWGFAIRLLDVDDDSVLAETYSDRVPVIRTASGTVIDEGRVSALRVTASLMKLKTSRPGG